MPNDVTDLAGAETDQEQFPISLVQFEIPGFAFNRINDTDLTVYLNPTTNAVAMAPGAGLEAFVPYSGLTVPKMVFGATQTLGEVSITVSNIEQDWVDIVADGSYSESLCTIWQGNLNQDNDTPPDAVTFTGVITRYVGRLEQIELTGKTLATILVSPHVTQQTVSWPYRKFSAPEFKHLPPPGAKLTFGFTVVDL